ncbi:MAG: PrsW family intramembrane metalloprotease [Anaerolineae bacterium]
MNPLQLILAAAISVGIPLVFLTIIYTLDLYASRTFRLVLISFAWGAIGGVGLSYLFNSYVAVPLIQRLNLDYLFLFVLFAPFAEELLKAVSLIYISRHPDFTYFVDGAIYGFAAGIGFSITENFLYISRHPQTAVPLALVRAFSTCLMHGTAAGLVGAAVGRFRFQRRSSRGLAVVVGAITAIGLHAAFNAVSQIDLVSDALVTPIAVGIGLLGVGLIGYFINQGLQEEGQWMVETLDRKINVSAAEARAARSFGTVDELLEPIAEQFPEKAEQVEALLLRQAQLGIKSKVLQKVEAPATRQKLEQDIKTLRSEMEELRHQIGPYVMIYVRSVFPEGAFNIWNNLELLAARHGPADLQRWAKMLQPKADTTPARSIFDRIGADRDEG